MLHHWITVRGNFFQTRSIVDILMQDYFPSVLLDNREGSSATERFACDWTTMVFFGTISTKQEDRWFSTTA